MKQPYMEQHNLSSAYSAPALRLHVMAVEQGFAATGSLENVTEAATDTEW